VERSGHGGSPDWDVCSGPGRYRSPSYAGILPIGAVFGGPLPRDLHCGAKERCESGRIGLTANEGFGVPRPASNGHHR